MLIKLFVSRTFLLSVLTALGLYTLVVYVICLLAFWEQFAVLWLLPVSLLGGVFFYLYTALKKNPAMLSIITGLTSGARTPKKPDTAEELSGQILASMVKKSVYSDGATTPSLGLNPLPNLDFNSVNPTNKDELKKFIEVQINTLKSDYEKLCKL